jgi:hypothetical protein
MTKAYPKSAPTHEQIAMFGHIAATLRKVMRDRKWTVADMNEICGFKRNATTLYPTLRSATAPSNAVRQLLMEKIGIPEQDLLPRELSTQVAVREPSQHTVIRPVNTSPVLSFTVSADGTARIKLDAAMSLSDAAPLLRILLDAGIVSSIQGDDNDQA